MQYCNECDDIFTVTQAQEMETFGVHASQDAGASIKVISTKDGVQREVTYGSLDRKAQEEVLTDLLVKSAVHYAMKKQQVSYTCYSTGHVRYIVAGRSVLGGNAYRPAGEKCGTLCLEKTIGER